LRAEGPSEQGQYRIKASQFHKVFAIRAVHVARFPSHYCIDNPSSGRRSLLQEHAGYKVRERDQADPLSKKQLEQITSPAPETDSDDDSEVALANLRLITSQTQRSTISFRCSDQLAFAVFLRTAKLTCEAKDSRQAFSSTQNFKTLCFYSVRANQPHRRRNRSRKRGEVTWPTHPVYPRPTTASPTHNGTLRLPRNKYINEMRSVTIPQMLPRPQPEHRILDTTSTPRSVIF